MSLGVAGNSKEAALFLPVPAPATVKLADSRMFDALEEMTKPRIRARVAENRGKGGGGGGGPSVTVLKRQALGPFDVSTLAANDAGALDNWLQKNGYKVPDGLAEVVQPYVDQGWYYVAARLRPGAGSKAVGGLLDPLWVSFPSDQIVYPMRITSRARVDPSLGSYPVYLYVLADHRVNEPKSMASIFGNIETEYADWVDPATLPEDLPLLPLVPRTLFLTKFEIGIHEPATIKDDFVFSFAHQDETFRAIEEHYVSAPEATAIAEQASGETDGQANQGEDQGDSSVQVPEAGAGGTAREVGVPWGPGLLFVLLLMGPISVWGRHHKHLGKRTK